MAEELENGQGNGKSTSARDIMKRVEGKILACGLLLVVLYCQFLLVFALFDAEYAMGLATMSLAHFFGRAAGLTHGFYVLDYASWVVISVNALLETIAVLVVYPLFVLTMENFVVWKALQGRIRNIRDSAEHSKKWVRRFGLLGLFLFVLFPFWMTGPIIGCIIGYMLHMRIWVNLSVVLGGTYVAILMWATIFRSLQEKVEAYGAWAPVVIVGLIIVGSAVMHFLHKKCNGNQKDASKDMSSAPSDAPDMDNEN